MIRKINTNSPEFTHRHKPDVERIQSIIRNNGYEADLEDCACIWEEYSDMYAAGWLGLGEDDDGVWNCIRITVLEIASNYE